MSCLFTMIFTQKSLTKHLKFYQQLDLDQAEESAWDKWVLISREQLVSPPRAQVEGRRDG